MARTGPASIVESGWPRGVWRAGATELEPEGSAYEITGLIGDDALPYRRGGSTYKSNAAFGAAGLLSLWTGQLGSGQRTVFARSGTWGRLLVDDATPRTLALTAPAVPVRPVQVAGMVVMPGVGSDSLGFYGGSLKTANYSTGTVAVTHASRKVTGTGTAWLANVDAGMVFQSFDGRWYAVQSVESDTALTLAVPYAGNATSGVTYALNEVGQGAPTYLGYTGLKFTPTIIAAIANRLAAIDPAATHDVRFSPIAEPNAFIETDYHSFAAPVLGLASLRDTLLVFTAGGTYAISNMAYELTDASGNPQQRVDLINADLILWSHEGVASWKGSLVVPALDGIWLMDTVSGPTRISDRITDLYLSYVRTSGYKTGVAEVFNGHYLLPILNSSNGWVDTLVCRLQATHQGTTFSWSQLAGSAAQVAAFSERTSNPPALLAASSATASRLLDVTGYFSPAAAIKNDADATTHTFRLTTRNIPIGEKTTAVLHMRAKYSLVDAASDNPTITAEASVDGGSYTTLSVTTGTTGTTAGEQDGTQWVYWTVSLAAQNIRFRFTCSNPAASLTFKKMELFYRPRGN